MDLSICIASYDSRDYLLQCLEAIAADPPVVSYEIIVVNDDSGDGTAEAIATQFPEVRFSENPDRGGIARGFNMAFVQASGRYLLQLSADVLSKPGAIHTLYTFMESHPEAGMAGAQVLNPDGSLQPCGRRFPTLWSVLWNKIRFHLTDPAVYYRMPYRNYQVVEEVDELPNACLIIRRETYEQVGGLDEQLRRFYDDIEWCIRIKKHGWKIYYVPQAQVIHYCYYTQYAARDAVHLIFTGYYSELYVFKKHYPSWEFMVLRCVELVEIVLRMSKWALLFFMHPPERRVFQDRLRIGWQTIKMALTL